MLKSLRWRPAGLPLIYQIIASSNGTPDHGSQQGGAPLSGLEAGFLSSEIFAKNRPDCKFVRLPMGNRVRNILDNRTRTRTPKMIGNRSTSGDKIKTKIATKIRRWKMPGQKWTSEKVLINAETARSIQIEEYFKTQQIK